MKMDLKKKRTFFSWRDDEARESSVIMLSIVIIAIRFEVDAKSMGSEFEK